MISYRKNLPPKNVQTLDNSKYNIASYVTGNNGWSTGFAWGWFSKQIDGQWLMKYTLYGTSSSVQDINLTWTGGITSSSVHVPAYGSTNTNNYYITSRFSGTTLSIWGGSYSWTIWYNAGTILIPTKPSFVKDLYELYA